MATAPLVPTIFATGAKDKLAAVDTYKAKPGAKPVNSIQALSEKTGFDIGSIFGGLNTAASLGAVMKMAGGGKLAFDKNVLTARLLSTSSKITSSFRSLSDSAKAGMSDMLDTESLVAFKIGEVTSYVDSAQIESVDALGDFIADYTGDKNMCKLEDHDAIGGLIGGLVTEGSDLGIEGMWPSLTSGIEDAAILTKSAAGAMPKLLSNGDLSTIFDISGSPAGKGMGVLFPTLGSDLASAFRLSASKGTQDQLGQFNKYLGTMNNIFGDWDRTVRGGDGDEGFTLNLFRMMGSSRTFQDMIITGVKMLTDDNDPKKGYLVHGLYKETTVEEEIKRFFPQVALISKVAPRQVEKKNTMDPRLLVQLGAMGGAILTG